MTHLEYLHESSDVQLGVQREVVDVRDEGGDLLLEEGELVLERVDGHGVVALVVRVVVVGAGVLRDALTALLCLGINRRSARLVVVAVMEVGVGDEALDGLLGIVDAARELVGLRAGKGKEREVGRVRAGRGAENSWHAPSFSGNCGSCRAPARACA